MNLILLALLSVTQAQPRDTPPKPRHFYTEWTYHRPRTNGVRWYYYKSNADDQAFQRWRFTFYQRPIRTDCTTSMPQRASSTPEWTGNFQYLQIIPAGGIQTESKTYRPADFRLPAAPTRKILAAGDGHYIDWIESTARASPRIHRSVGRITGGNYNTRLEARCLSSRRN